VGYQVTAERIHGEIARVQALGWQLGLSSDTPLESLERWSREFGLNGPIIAERGALLRLNNGREISIHESGEYFGKLKRRLSDYMVNQRIPFYHGDVTQLIRNRPNLLNMVDEHVILLQAYRRHSLSFYARKVDTTGELVPDNDGLISFVGTIQRMLGKSPFKLTEDVNPEYGIYIISPAEVSKRAAALVLMRELGIGEIGMIGDSTTDILGTDIAMHYAVGNAKDDFKEISKYTSLQSTTSGVVDILQHIKE
jgi:hydroxymethylpyrimidine pyrophosphatase-like HAD family hydrolase